MIKSLLEMVNRLSKTMEQNLVDEKGHCYVSLSYDPDHRWVYVEWFGEQPNGQIVKGCNAMYDMFCDKECHKILNDGSQVTGSWEGANKWIEENIVEKIIAAGLEYYAHVIPDDLQAKLSIVDLHRRVADKTHMRVFSEVEKAKEWLDSFQ